MERLNEKKFYKEEIEKLVNKIDDVKFLRRIYIILIEHNKKKTGN